MSLIAKILFLILAAQVVVCFAQNKALAPFLNIKPFINTRKDVEKIYGKGEINRNKYFVTYKHADGLVTVEYAWGGDCQNSYDDWNVPEWTVTEISYSFWQNLTKLKDLIRNNKKFKKTAYGDVIGQMKYYDEESGIVIYFDKFKKKADEIAIKPSIKDEQKFACENLK